MTEIDTVAIARRHYRRRLNDPSVSTLTVAIEARRELEAAISQAQAQGDNIDAARVRRLQHALGEALLAAAGAREG